MAESMQGLKRTHRCGELSAANVGETVTIMGWVQKNRNKGGLVFTDVRDRSGIIQVVCEEGTTDAAIIEKAASLRAEYVVAVVGKVEKRSGAVNDHLATGEIEVIPEELRILSESETPPFHIEENSKTKEEVTDWYNIEVWDKQAEFAGEYIKKGRQVVVDGRISISKWTDQTGEERERFLIVANNVRLLGSKRDAE
mgnify:CR=1 FL=1